MLIILLLCGGGYYEYNDLQQKSAAAQLQISDLSAKVDKLEADNKALEDDKTRLTKMANDAQTEITDLAKQLQAAHGGLAQARPSAAQPPTANAPAMAATAGNSLGAISTLNGKTFQNCQLLKIKAEGIIINHSEGITEIEYGLLPLDLQKRFGYDPRQAAALTEAQIQFQEQQRKAAADSAGR